MSSTGRLLITASVMASILTFGLPASAKPSPGGGGDATRVEDLGWPAGAVSSDAQDISDSGSLVAGRAYWPASFEYTNNWYAARWSRNAATGAWQAEDLRPLLPVHRWSEAMLVNNSGTTVVRIMDPVPERWFAIMASGATVELGTNHVASDLDDAERMVGFAWSENSQVPETPLYWTSPTATPVELPVLESGYGGRAQWFEDVNILGVLADAAGSWLARWSWTDEGWGVVRLQQLPAGYMLIGVSSGGRLALKHCTGTPSTGCGARAAAWDPPYVAAPVYLPNLGKTYSWPDGVNRDGPIFGVTVANNGVDMVPVWWPTPTALLKLPLLYGAKAGTVNRGNAHRQVTGSAGAHGVVWTLP